MGLIELTKRAQQKAERKNLVALEDVVDGFPAGLQADIRRFVNAAGRGWEGCYYLEDHPSLHEAEQKGRSDAGPLFFQFSGV